ncbi:MAG: peptidoglycan-associated lipoprotein Pal [Legionellales bacterium]|nr:peptidoglycan-associated lipoprotein Pal [Legionellales bacterium]
MKLGTIIKQSAIIVTALLFAACAKHHGIANDSDGMSSAGLGSAFGGFGSDSAAGESYTNKAPHNQVYLFAYDDASFNEKYTESVHAQARYLASHSGANVMIAGHTDELGSHEYNVALGERRANTVADILKMDGVSRNQIRVVSYGKERPANIGHDETAHAANRRVELTYEATR